MDVNRGTGLDGGVSVQWVNQKTFVLMLRVIYLGSGGIGGNSENLKNLRWITPSKPSSPPQRKSRHI